jgi:hypothetical protein
MAIWELIRLMLGFEVYSHLKKTSNVLKSVWTRRWREECSSFGQLQLVIVGGVVVECGSFVEVDSLEPLVPAPTLGGFLLGLGCESDADHCSGLLVSPLGSVD